MSTACVNRKGVTDNVKAIQGVKSRGWTKKILWLGELQCKKVLGKFKLDKAVPHVCGLNSPFHDDDDDDDDDEDDDDDDEDEDDDDGDGDDDDDDDGDGDDDDDAGDDDDDGDGDGDGDGDDDDDDHCYYCYYSFYYFYDTTCIIGIVFTIPIVIANPNPLI